MTTLRIIDTLKTHGDNVLKLALSALTYINAKLDKGMSTDEQMHTICSHVSGYLNSEGRSPYHHEIKLILRKTAKKWQHYSKNSTCPVPAPSDFSTGDSALPPEEKIYERVFHGYLYEGSFWDSTTEYGRMRADLLGHHIKVISDELNSRSATQVT